MLKRTSATSIVRIVRGLAVLAGVLLAACGAAQDGPRTTFATIAIGERVDAVLSAATNEAYATHAYTLEVPAGTTSLTITIEAGDADLDLAVSTRGPIESFDGLAHLDVDPGPPEPFTLPAPAAGTLHVEVLNLTRSRAPYTLAVSADGIPAVAAEPEDDAPTTPDAQPEARPDARPDEPPAPQAESFPDPVAADGGAMPSGRYGPLPLPGGTDGVLAGEAYHSFWIDVPAGVARLRVTVDGRGSDLDLALKAGEPITSYENVDFIDTSADPNPTATIDIVAAVRIYVDVLNFASEPAAYRIDVDVPGGVTPVRNPLGQDRWTGTFRGDGLEVVVAREDGAYGGTLTLGTQTYPFEARLRDGRLEGDFFSGGSSFGFVATLDGDVMQVESGGATYRTVRSEGAP